MDRIQGGFMVKGNLKLFYWRLGFVGVMLLAAGAGWMPGSQAEATPPGSKQLLVLYPAKTFEGGKAHFYEHKTDAGTTIKYFILQSSDGVIRAAFDACDVCWAEGKGYSQKGDFMICNNCKQRFASARINEVKGGCNPHPLNRQVVDGNVVIKIPDILEGARFFQLAKKGSR
jgi:uncharacterized membrane protein